MAQNEQRRSQPEAIFSGAVTPPASRLRITCGPEAGATPVGKVGEVNLALGLRLLAAGRAHRQQRAAVPGHVRGPLLAREHVVEAGGDVGVVVEAEHLGVDVLFGEGGGELGSVALGQAPDGGDLDARSGRLDHLVDGLLLGRLDEAAGVDEDDVRVLALVAQRPPARRQAGGELLGVHLVARAAEGNQADGTGTRHTQSVRDCATPSGHRRGYPSAPNRRSADLDRGLAERVDAQPWPPGPCSGAGSCRSPSA